VHQVGWLITEINILRCTVSKTSKTLMFLYFHWRTLLLFVLPLNHNQTYFNPHTFKLCPRNHWEALSRWSIYLTKEVSLEVPGHSSQQNTHLSLQHLSCHSCQTPQYLKLTLCVYFTKWITNAHETWCHLNISYMLHVRSKASVETFHCIYRVIENDGRNLKPL